MYRKTRFSTSGFSYQTDPGLQRFRIWLQIREDKVCSVSDVIDTSVLRAKWAIDSADKNMTSLNLKIFNIQEL
jgi:hypothetical protein